MEGVKEACQECLGSLIRPVAQEVPILAWLPAITLYLHDYRSYKDYRDKAFSQEVRLLACS